MPHGQERPPGPDRRGPLSWAQLELPFGEQAIGTPVGRVSLTSNPLAEAEKLIATPGFYARQLSVAEELAEYRIAERERLYGLQSDL